MDSSIIIADGLFILLLIIKIKVLIRIISMLPDFSFKKYLKKQYDYYKTSHPSEVKEFEEELSKFKIKHHME